MSPEDSGSVKQFVTFTLEEEVFALDIAKVREVLDCMSVTRIPQTPPFLKGIINVRGSAVPVVDMRIKFGLPPAGATAETCIIITEVDLEGQATIIGAMADSVEEVLELESEQIEAPPKIGTKLKTEFIKGMGKHGERFLIILDIDKIFSSDELLLETIEAKDSVSIA